MYFSLHNASIIIESANDDRHITEVGIGMYDDNIVIINRSKKITWYSGRNDGSENLNNFVRGNCVRCPLR